MTNEENNEWKWNVQQLDDVAKALLLCLNNTKLQYRSEMGTVKNEKAIMNDANQKPNVKQQKESGDAQHLVVNESSSRVLKEVTRDHMQCAESLEVIPLKRNIAGLDVKELFLNAAKTGQWEEVVGALSTDKAMFLQIFDGGGQPSFQEIFPLLINGSSVIILIFKLTDDLETAYPVHYQPENKNKRLITWQDTYIVKDIISHALSSFVSQQDTSFPGKILLVGTHKDKLDVSQDPQECNIKDKILNIATQLHGWLHQSTAFETIQVRSIEELITGIDNSNEQDIVSVRKKIEELLSELDTQEIPAPWLVFDFVLHKYAKVEKLRSVSKSNCKDIAHICGVKEDEINVVLHYLHSEAGTLLYYSDIPRLNECVITDFQLLFDSISKIIIQYFDYHSKHGPHMKYKNQFKCKGQLDASILKRVEGCLEVDELLSLLRHRHIISNLEGTNIYFMPSVLPKTTLSYNLSNNFSSFLILFDHGYCPVGLFCAATTGLIVSRKWKVNNGESQYRNKINFYCICSGKSYSVLFSAFSAHYEVSLMGESLPHVKCMIYNDINNVFAKVCRDMNYPFPSYGFYCPKTCQCDSFSYSQNQHPAMCTFSCDTQEMKCCYSDTPTDLADEHKQWFQQVCVTIALLFKCYMKISCCKMCQSITHIVVAWKL